MLKRRFNFVMTALFGLTLCVQAQTAGQQSVGLVLSGGGAKGIAHIGVIQALEDNDIAIDYVTGTSMGSIVGGLYAAGYTPEEMMQLIESRGFSYWSTGKTDPRLSYYFNQPEPSPTIYSMNFGGRRNSAADSVPASIISPLPMSFAFMELFSCYTAQCGSDFDKLFVPYRCVASDPTAHRKKVFRSGQLGDAIRASMSFPLIFQPVEINDTLYYDGGIYDNFPFDVMREDFAPDIMIGVDVSTEDTGPQTTLYDQLDKLIVQGGSHDLPADQGIKLRIDLNEFGLLDFPLARKIYKVGYDYAMSMMDSIKTRVTARRPAEVTNLRRSVFKAGTPYTRFADTKVYGASKSQNDYIRYLFRPAAGSDTIGIARARDAFYRALSSGTLKNLYPQAIYDNSTGLFDLTLKAAVKPPLSASVGGYLTSSTSSYIFVGVDYSTLSFRSLNSGVKAWIGQTSMAGELHSRLLLHTRLSSAIELQAVASRLKYYESEKMFFEARQPTFLTRRDYFGRLGWSCAAGRLAKLSVAGGYGSVHTDFYRNNRLSSYQEGKLKAVEHLAQAMIRYTSSTLDSPDMPTTGQSYDFTAKGYTGHTDVDGARVDTRWAQLQLNTRLYPALSKKVSLGVETDFMLSTRKLLPTYSATIATAPQFAPTPASAAAFRPAFRANSYLAAGLVPMYRFNQSMNLRLGAYAFVPMRAVLEGAADRPVYGRWFNNPQCYTELNLSYKLPLPCTVSGYVSYATTQGDRWNVGISLGVYIAPPRF